MTFFMCPDWGAMHFLKVTPMISARGYAAHDAQSPLRAFAFERDEPGERDVQIQVLFCGVCHSDIHQAKNEWSNTTYPCVPGHEVVGRVTKIGAGVTTHAVGDIVGVGCMIDSCRHCKPCKLGLENYCVGPNSWLATYNGPMVPAKMAPDGLNMYGRDNTYGGYSDVLVVRDDFLIRIPQALKPEVAAPILCAGVTTFSPMKHWGVKAGQKVGIIGFGGLGNMAIKLALAMGAQVVVFTSSSAKFDEARTLGAEPVLESDAKALALHASSFDFMLSTVPQKHDLNPYLPLLKRDCTLVVVGALEVMEPVNNQQVAFHRRSVSGSLIGSIAETQEVIDFCAKHGIGPDIEMLRIQDLNEAYTHIEKGEVRFRYVIDMASLAEESVPA
jgi:uncharacterized zinc-type alcohol dehydrogenase-like protein